MSDANTKWVTARDLADWTGLNYATICLYCRAGKLKGAKKLRGTRWVIPLDAANKLLGGDLDVSGVYADWRKNKK